MAEPYTPFGFRMPPMYATPDTLTGQEAAPPPAPPPPPFLRRLQDLGVGFLNPFGFAMPPPVQQTRMVPTLGGERELPVRATGMDMRPQDPMSAATGQALSAFGPVSGIANRIVASPVGQAVAGAIMSPRVAGPAAATAAMTAPAATQQPGPARRAPKARESLATVEGRQKEADKLVSDLRGRSARFEKMDWSNKDSVKEVQSILAGRGLNVRVDGIAGEETRRGLANYQRDLQQELQRAEAAQQRLGDELTRAQTGVTEAERLDTQTEGSQRLKEIGEPGLLETYGPLAGYPLGFVIGLKGRQKLGGFVSQRAEQRAQRADTLAGGFGQGAVPERAGRLNQYWTEGGGAPAPFSFAPNTRPFPWASVPNAPTADKLYRPGLGANIGPGATVMGSGAVEAGAGAHFGGQAHQELQAAQAAISTPGGETEANIQRLLAARRSAALWETLGNVGRGTMVGGGVGEAKSRIQQGAGARPNVGLAEAERGNLDLLLNPPEAPPTPPPAGPQPRWDDRIGRWRLNGGFVSPPEGAAPPPQRPRQPRRKP